MTDLFKALEPFANFGAGFILAIAILVYQARYIAPLISEKKKKDLLIQELQNKVDSISESILALLKVNETMIKFSEEMMDRLLKIVENRER